ncbi:hypothetical protein [Glutamicibacter sp. 2E12]|uniref:hypothetical protein n=1 Tax=Glutamicibacter sp. 2E12 TaxID=3416181 RepID=UPI003CF51285
MSIQPANPAPTSAELAMPTMPGAAGIAGLESWVNALSHANKIASFMAQSNFVPTPLRSKGKGSFKSLDELTLDVTAIIMAGASIGYDPFQSVQQMFIVHGSPAMYARSMVALVKSHGHKLDQASSTPEAVTVRARHRDESEWHEFTWTIQRAATAGYTSNPKYKSNPQEMLYAKAATEACRRMFPEVLSGISPYSVEESELEDLGEQPTAGSATEAPVKTRKMSRKAPAKSAAPAAAAPAATVEPAQAAPTTLPPEPEEVGANVDTQTGEVQDEGTPAALELSWDEKIEQREGDAVALRSLYNEAQAWGADRETLDRIVTAGQKASQS